MQRGVTRRFALVLVLAALAGSGCAARLAYHQGQEEAKRGNWDLAVARLTRAVQKDPDNIGYKIALENARIQASRMHFDLARKHLQAADLEKAAEELDIATKYDPSNKSASDELALVRARIRTRDAQLSEMSDFESKRQRAAARPSVPVLSPRSLAPIALNYRDQSLQRLLETLGKLAGVNVLFDEGFRDKNVTVSLTGVTFQEALDQITMVNRLFYKVLDQNTIIIVPESQAKRRAYDAMLMQTFYLQNAETKDVETIVKTAVGTTARVVSNPTLGAINVIGTADQLAVVSRLLDLNDKARGEVVVEVQILEVDREQIKNYGIELAERRQGVALTYAPIEDPAGAGPVSVRAHLLSSLNAADFLVTLPSTVLATFLQTEGNTKILASPRLRAAEGKKTSLKIGTEVPVPVTTFTAAQTGGVGGTFAPATSFQYRNVGVNLELTPRVTPNGDIVLEMAAEFSLPGGDSVARPARPSRPSSPGTSTGRCACATARPRCSAACCRTAEIETFTGIIGLQSIPILNRILTGTREDEDADRDPLLHHPAPGARAEDQRGGPPVDVHRDAGDPARARRRRPAVRRAGAGALSGGRRRPRRRPAPRPGVPRGRCRPSMPEPGRGAHAGRDASARPDGGADAVARPRAGHRAHARRRGRSCRSRRHRRRSAGVGAVAGPAAGPCSEPPAPAASRPRGRARRGPAPAGPGPVDGVVQPSGGPGGGRRDDHGRDRRDGRAGPDVGRARR